MFLASCPLILASASPRRQAYLARLELPYRCVPATIDETPAGGEAPEAFARRMAAAKAGQVAAAHPGACVIGADTVVALDHQIFGKPRDQAEALTILRTLQGRTHAVITGLAVILNQRAISEVSATTTLVTFDDFDDQILQAYVDSGEPMDKAGAYGIQGRAGMFVEHLAGSFTGVMGLPVCETGELLKRLGFRPL